MKLSWQITHSGSLPAQAIMAKDAELLQGMTANSQPILHLYAWETASLTYGYFTNPTRYLDLAALEKYGICTARRPTGGGIIFHLTDLAFSVLIPSSHPNFSLNTLENYKWINGQVGQAIAQFSAQLKPTILTDAPAVRQNSSFCMAKPTIYDLMIEGKKVGGAAQRRTKLGLLHQGSISLAFPPLEVLNAVLKNPSQVTADMQQSSFCLMPDLPDQELIEKTRYQLSQLLIEVFCKVELKRFWGKESFC